MPKFSILWVSLLLFLMGGCTTKQYTISEPKLITIKSPKLKFSDMGYIRYADDAVEVELFTAGVAVEKISIDRNVCVSAGCMREEAFNRDYLYEGYPSDTMRRILQNAPIFDGNNTSESCGGMKTQYIRNETMDIVYQRKTGEIYFKDRMNGLMIKIRDVQESNGTE
ncbi:MAG: hypothetical protein NTY39_01240 [Campylobacterales bacterium]|nr:hypothetical protein [Campylobacterales bacterium]